MTTETTVDSQQSAQELAATIREALLHLVHTESKDIRRILPQALSAVEAHAPGDAGLRAAGDTLRTLAEGGLSSNSPSLRWTSMTWPWLQRCGPDRASSW